jgi:hypothetical protein
MSIAPTSWNRVRDRRSISDECASSTLKIQSGSSRARPISAEIAIRLAISPAACPHMPSATIIT